MKTAFILILLVGTAFGTKAQTFSEFFRQKKTQKKYLLQQIAALQVYLEYSKNGYLIAKNGLADIGRFKRGDFNLHARYFNSLKQVNPLIGQSEKATAIIALQVEIIKQSRRSARQLLRGNALSSGEKRYVQRVFSRLLTNCEELLDALIAVTREGEVEMKDDQRLARIDLLYQQMVGNSIFCQRFSEETAGLAASRKTEYRDVKWGRSLHALKAE